MMGSVPPGYHMSRLTCSAPTSLPGSTVHVIVGDMGMTSMMGGVAPLGGHMMLRAFPASVPTGQVSFVVGNMGGEPTRWSCSRWHRVRPLGSGPQAPTARSTRPAASVKPQPHVPRGPGDGIKPGSVGWVTLTLPAGRYELVCNLRNHYANGMHQAFVVTGH